MTDESKSKLKKSSMPITQNQCLCRPLTKLLSKNSLSPRAYAALPRRLDFLWRYCVAHASKLPSHPGNFLCKALKLNLWLICSFFSAFLSQSPLCTNFFVALQRRLAYLFSRVSLNDIYVFLSFL